MINQGDVIKVMEHPYSDQTYFVGEVIATHADSLVCLALSRVRAGRPVPLDSAHDKFATARPDHDSMHDRYRARLGRPPRIQRLKQAVSEPVWRPGVA